MLSPKYKKGDTLHYIENNPFNFNIPIERTFIVKSYHIVLGEYIRYSGLETTSKQEQWVEEDRLYV